MLNPKLNIHTFRLDNKKVYKLGELDTDFNGKTIENTDIDDNNVAYADNGGDLVGSDRLTFIESAGRLQCGRFNTNTGGNGSVLFGQSCQINGNYSFCGGFSSSSTNTNTFTWGSDNTNSSENSAIVGGFNNTATTGSMNLLTGSSNSTSGSRNFVCGTGNVVGGDYSICSGNSNTCSGDYAVCMGNANTNASESGIVLGTLCSATNFNSIAIGNTCISQGNQAISIGNGARANWGSTLCLGNIRTTSASGQVAIGAVNNNNTRINATQEETITLHARNTGNYDDGIQIFSGDASSLKSITTKEHGNTLTWSYTPTTSGDWSSAPDNIGEGLDTLASDLNSLVIPTVPTLSSGSYVPDPGFTFSAGTGRWFRGEYQRIGNFVQCHVSIVHPLASSSTLWSDMYITLPINRTSTFSTFGQELIGQGCVKTSAYETVATTRGAFLTNNQFRVLWDHTGSPTVIDLNVSFCYEI